jgi:flagellar M-ring protein FliF
VRAGVTVDVDFTVNEQTAERFNPDLPALRSEQVNEQSSSLSAVQGVPGALSNQPPAAGSAPEQAVGGQDGTQADSGQPINSSKRATRNYELDKTISHTKVASGVLRKLSIAVVVDDLVTKTGGSEERTKRTPEEIERFTQLVKEAVGFNELRGDSVSVINASFQVPVPPAPLPEQAIWEKPWVWDLAKQVVGVILVLVLVFVVLLPTIRKLSEAPPPPQYVATEGVGAALSGGGAPGGSLEGGGETLQLPGKGKYEDTLDAARQLVSEDPMRVAQVVRSWVAEDG